MAVIAISVAVLEIARHAVVITRPNVGQTPVVSYAKTGADGPMVIVGHGFAGSERMMQGYALPLARAGYRVYAFDFLGHGRNPLPMSGDVSSIDGTTRLLVAQINEVADAVAQEGDTLALLGHSMATDILVRVAANRDDVGPVVLVSAFSQEIDAQTPQNLLLIAGAWETGLRAFADASLRMVNPGAVEGETVVNGPVSRRAIAAPWSEHVSVLQSRVARQEALAWLDRAYGRTSDIVILPTGWAILGLLAGLVIAFRPLSALLSEQRSVMPPLSRAKTGMVILLPVVIAPLTAAALDTDILPVLVADYLAVHMFIFGTLQLVLLRVWRISVGPILWSAFAILLLACAAFGFAMDRYVANFWPTEERLWIIAAMMIGTVPCMLADSLLTARQSIFGRLCTRAGFLASLGIAIAIDFQGLFFLLLITPVLVLFYLVFGTMGRATSIQSGPLSAGLALGVVLAWALGVSFPVFEG